MARMGVALCRSERVGKPDRTLAIEDRLSDALHEKLTQRFVDRLARLDDQRHDFFFEGLPIDLPWSLL